MGSEEDSCWEERKLAVVKQGSFPVGSDAASQWEVM